MPHRRLFVVVSFFVSDPDDNIARKHREKERYAHLIGYRCVYNRLVYNCDFCCCSENLNINRPNRFSQCTINTKKTQVVMDSRGLPHSPTKRPIVPDPNKIPSIMYYKFKYSSSLRKPIDTLKCDLSTQSDNNVVQTYQTTPDRIEWEWVENSSIFGCFCRNVLRIQTIYG